MITRCSVIYAKTGIPTSETSGGKVCGSWRSIDSGAGATDSDTAIVRAPFSFLYKLLFKFIQIITGSRTSLRSECRQTVQDRPFRRCNSEWRRHIGDDVVIRNGVTIGLRRTGVRGSPKIGNRVDIGAGAKILGPITVGDDTTIGANAVVLEDVPPNSIAIGIPAKAIARHHANGCAEPKTSRGSPGHDE